MHVEEIERSALNRTGLGILNRKQGGILQLGKDGKNLESKIWGERLIQAWIQWEAGQ